MAIALVATAGIYSTRAYFTDTEVSTGNEIQAGTIDISVDGENPWAKDYNEVLNANGDFKPGVKKTISFVVKNEGVNPLILRKSIGNFVSTQVFQSEPQCAAVSGLWNGTSCTGGAAQDLSKVMLYSMTVTPEGGSPIVVIPESAGTKMSDVNSLWFPLGKIDPSKTLTVTQTYQLDPEADNRYQGYKLSFDITLFAEQKMGPGEDTTLGVILDNKTGSPDWYPVVDGIWAIVLRDGTTANLKAFGLTPGQTYHFQYSLTPYSTGTTMVSGVAGGDGTLSLSGTLPGSMTDGKLWLRDNAWSEAGTLWETNLISY